MVSRNTKHHTFARPHANAPMKAHPAWGLQEGCGEITISLAARFDVGWGYGLFAIMVTPVAYRVVAGAVVAAVVDGASLVLITRHGFNLQDWLSVNQPREMGAFTSTSAAARSRIIVVSPFRAVCCTRAVA